LLDGIQSVDEARHIADRIQDLLTPPFEISGHCIVITASIGIALVDLNKPEEALRHADIAMYRAKNGGKARHEVFEPSVDTHAMDQLQLESDLRDGMKDGSFRMYYQPIVCLQTGAVESFEALLRWHHPRRGILLPSEFLSVAEEAGLALQLGDLVLRQSCNHLRAWRRHRSVHSRLRTNVNLSSKQFANPLVVDEFHQVLEDAELDGDALTIELTEGIIMENRALAAEKLRRLRDLGVTLAIDDFGTGYSSLARLQDFPITALKVDASFVSKITEGRPQIFDAIIALANELKLEVTAEGVETAEQFSYVKNSGAAKCQGLFLSEAMTAEAAEQMLTTEPPWMSFFSEHVTEKPKKGFVARAPR
jgi:EAL domain-containing protein (putative c-di-GMP-specific phosphodiesterase class I)